MNTSFLKNKKFWIFSVIAVFLIILIVLLAVFLTYEETDQNEDAFTTTELPTSIVTEPNLKKRFPSNFIFGAASSAYQVEGAWDKDGKRPSVWDEFTHKFPDKIEDCSNGDVAANSYEFYKEDVKALKEIGLDFYRFSISWSRVLPDGDISSRNEHGLQYYDKLINELLSNGIEPMVTMFHWDLPQNLQIFGGWTNPLMIDYFEQYAILLIERYGDRVKYWNTFNEPMVFCEYGYERGILAPNLNASGVGGYLCGHHVLLANARVYHLYKEKYYNKFGGSIGIALNAILAIPKNSTNQDDIDAADRYMQFWLGWFAHPILSKTGGYHQVIKDIIDRNSELENLAWSRLPVFTDSEKNLIRGSSDFLGINFYTSKYTEPDPYVHDKPNPSSDRDRNVSLSSDPDWLLGNLDYINSEPAGLRSCLNWIKKEYNNPDVIITENGWPDDGELNDLGRIQYIKTYMAAVLDAIVEDGCNIFGYTYWSLIDNFEWLAGYQAKFGLYHVNFDSSNKTRTPKASVKIMQAIITTRQIPDDDDSYPDIDDDRNKFPNRFLFASASSSYQVEGAWNQDDKGPNIWDELTHKYPEKILDGSNGDVAANSYEFYKEDIKALKEIGVGFYRFSVSWSRVLPNGDISYINKRGLQYYNNVINELLANDIEPIITIYHWDLPQSLQIFGGWTNSIIVDYFEQYAKLLFDEFGNRVRYWITINEPYMLCLKGYGTGESAPNVVSPGIGEYLCGHHVLLSHARVYHLYKKNYFRKYGGKIAMAVNSRFTWPIDPSNKEDVAAATRYIQFTFGWFAHPIFSGTGDYPSVMIDVIANNSLNENLKWSRLPVFSKEEKALLNGSSDFLALNYYTSYYVKLHSNLEATRNPSFERDMNVESIHINSTTIDAMGNANVPAGLRAILNWIKQEYKNPKLMITENGSSDNGTLNDPSQIDYLERHLQAVFDAIWIDGCHVFGYTYWSIIDNFEWLKGYTVKFGLYKVDVEDINKQRIPKDVSVLYKKIIKSKQLPSSTISKCTNHTNSERCNISNINAVSIFI